MPRKSRRKRFIPPTRRKQNEVKKQQIHQDLPENGSQDVDAAMSHDHSYMLDNATVQTPCMNITSQHESKEGPSTEPHALLHDAAETDTHLESYSDPEACWQSTSAVVQEPLIDIGGTTLACPALAKEDLPENGNQDVYAAISHDHTYVLSNATVQTPQINHPSPCININSQHESGEGPSTEPHALLHDAAETDAHSESNSDPVACWQSTSAVVKESLIDIGGTTLACPALAKEDLPENGNPIVNAAVPHDHPYILLIDNAQTPDIIISLQQDSEEGSSTELHGAGKKAHSESNGDFVAWQSTSTDVEQSVTDIGLTSSTCPAVAEEDHSSIFDEAVSILKSRLPPLWYGLRSEEGLHILMLSSSPAKLTQRSILINPKGIIDFFIHGHKLPRTHLVHQDLRPLRFDTVQVFCESLLQLISSFRLFEVCHGVPNLKLKPFWKKTVGSFVDRNDFHELRYNQTLRSENCLLVVPQNQRQCKPCRQVSNNLVRRKSAVMNTSQPNPFVMTPPKTKSIKNMTTPEILAKNRRAAKTITNLRKRNKRLQEKLASLIESEGVDVDEELSKNLQDSLETGLVDGNINEFAKVFIEEQIKANSRKDMRGMRWHPLMVRFALQLKLVSSAAYSLLASCPYVKFPSERTLYDYSHVMDITAGCCKSIIEDVAEQVKDLPNAYQKFHVLMADEVHVVQNLVQKRTTGEVVGYCKLNEVQQEFLQLGENLKAAATGTEVGGPTECSPPIATKIRAFLVKGAASGVCAVVAAYTLANDCKDDLNDQFWEVVEALECHEIKVFAFVCDGSSFNRGFMDQQPPVTNTPSGVIFVTTNRYALDRRIFFFSDPPHLIKTARNCLFNSGRKSRQKMMKNGETLTWEPIVKLFLQKKDMTVKKLHKLTKDCVFLNSYSVMNVKYAARVMSNSVANLLEKSEDPNTKELCVFEKV